MPDLSRQAKQRRRWAAEILRVASDVPSYGSPEFLQLDDGDARKVASVVRAAECWATAGDDYPWITELELEHHRRTEDAELAAFFRDAANRPIRSRWVLRPVVDVHLPDGDAA